jgi:hypothetical protein
MHIHKYIWVQQWQGLVKAYNIKQCSKCSKVVDRVLVFDLDKGVYNPSQL